MTDKDIVKALECCYVRGHCNDCPLEKERNKACAGIVMKTAFELIHRQKAEIKRLKRENEILSVNADTAFQDGLNEARDLYATEVENEIKDEAVREFAEKLKDIYSVHDGLHLTIDTLVKEMIGDK